jgi:hypothetical protein
MAIARDDRYITDALGCALAGVQVYYCLQPASTTVNPPSPLATIYSNLTGTPLTQPVISDGFGHMDAYLDNSVLYTVVAWHPLFGTNPVVLQDQVVAGAGSGGSSSTPIQASTNAGTITGAIPGAVFTLPSVPIAGSLILQYNGQVLTPGLGYSISGAVVTVANALQTGDNLNANYTTTA